MLRKSRAAMPEVAFESEADRFGNPTWGIFVAEPEPRDGPPAARQRASGSEAASADAEPPASAPPIWRLLRGDAAPRAP